MGPTDRCRRLDRARRVLPGTLVPLFSSFDLQGRRTEPDACPCGAGHDRFVLVRVRRFGGAPVVLAARWTDCRSDARRVCAGDLLRRTAAEVRARRVLRLPGVVADCRGHEKIAVVGMAGAGCCGWRL